MLVDAIISNKFLLRKMNVLKLFFLFYSDKNVVSVSRVLGRMDFGYFNTRNHDKIETIQTFISNG
jgi:hypothetical protein